MSRALAAALAIALVSVLLVEPAPSYDPWAWLLWGREVAGGSLSTLAGPAFKPLPVAVCALLAPVDSAAPWLWVALVRMAALLAAWLAYGLGRRLADGSRLAGALAATSVVLCGGLPYYAATGAEPALVLALGLGGAAAWRERRFRVALACTVCCALLRVEAWPFALAAGIALWRGRPQDRALLAALALAVPAAWLVPELVGSGDLLRSGARARVPNPGQPALERIPGLAALRAAVALPLWPLWAGVAALLARAALLPRRGGASDALRARALLLPAGGGASDELRTRAALAPAAAGAAWIAIVALMAQAGFSGEPRYALPGAALIAVSGASGLVLAARATPRGPALALAALAALVALAAAPRLGDLPSLRAAQAHQWRLAGELDTAIRAAGGRDAVLACGRPFVGRLRGPLMAYRMRVAKHVVEPDAAPRAPGVVFRSALARASAPAPAAGPGFVEVARTDRWQVLADCRT